MKQHLFLPLSALLCLFLLAGCQTAVHVEFDASQFAKAQKIVARDGSGTEKAVLTEKADIDAFLDAMDVDSWKMADLPPEHTKAGSFTLWQQETITVLLGKQEAEMKEICTFQCYQDLPYVTVDTGFAGLSLTFSIPQTAADYFQTLTME